MTDKIQIAKEMAKEAHKGQLYAGQDYFTKHVIGVTMNVTNCFMFEPRLAEELNENDCIVVALLHDVAEDNINYPVKYITGVFGPEIGHSIDCLTKRSGEEYDDYINRVLSDRMASFVKKNDALFNFSTCMKEKNMQRAEKYLNVIDKINDLFGW